MKGRDGHRRVPRLTQREEILTKDPYKLKTKSSTWRKKQSSLAKGSKNAISPREEGLGSNPKRVLGRYTLNARNYSRLVDYHIGLHLCDQPIGHRLCPRPKHEKIKKQCPLRH